MLKKGMWEIKPASAIAGQSHLDFWLALASTEQRERQGSRVPTRPFALSFRAKPEDEGQGSLRPSFQTPRYDRPVGSGFGGSVTSYRLAEAGLEVCLLERGKAYPPGSFPRAPQAMKRNFWDSSEGLYGLFDFWAFDHFEALVSSGLGGGSLIYANVLLRKDEEWFVKESVSGEDQEDWPVTRADLDPHYDRVEEMMNVQKYPVDESPYSDTPKTNAFRAAAEKLGLDCPPP